MARWLTAIDRYILRQVLPVVILVIAIAAIVLILDKLLSLLSLAMGSGAPPIILLRMLLSLFPTYIRVVLPLSLFVGVYLAFRNLSAQAELYAIESCGISIFRLLRFPLFLGVVLTVIDLLLTFYAEPLTRYAYNRLRYELTSGIARTGLEEGIFVSLPNGYTVRVARSRHGGREFAEFFGFRSNRDGSFETVVARYGRLAPSTISDDYIMTLLNGQFCTWRVETNARKCASFGHMSLPFDLDSVERFRPRGESERELTLRELISRYNSNHSNTPGAGRGGVNQPTSFQAVAAELHGRIIYALSTIVMPFLAVPFGIVTMRSSRMGGLYVGMGIVFAYHKVLEFQGKYAAVGGLTAGPVMWFTFAIFCACTLTLFLRTVKTTGSTPYQKFEESIGDKAMVAKRAFLRLMPAQFLR